MDQQSPTPPPSSVEGDAKVADEKGLSAGKEIGDPDSDKGTGPKEKKDVEIDEGLGEDEAIEGE